MHKNKQQYLYTHIYFNKTFNKCKIPHVITLFWVMMQTPDWIRVLYQLINDNSNTHKRKDQEIQYL